MGNAIDKVNSAVSKPTINKVNGKSASDYSQESAALQEDISEIYNQILLNDYDKAALEDDIDSGLDTFDEINDLQKNGPAMISSSQESLDAWYEMMMAPEGPVDSSNSTEMQAAVELYYSMMSSALANAEAMIPEIINEVQETQQDIEQRVDNFQARLDEGAENISESYEEGTKELLKAETEANGGQVVSGNGVQVTVDGSTNQDIYIEGSGNTVVISGDYEGDIVFAPDATDNTVIIEGDYGSEGSLAMGGKNNNVQVAGDTDAELVLGGDGNTLTTEGDVNSDVNFGGEGNTVVYGGEFNGDIPVNSSTFNTVKSIEEIEAENAELQGELNTLQNQQTVANANANAAANQQTANTVTGGANGGAVNTQPTLDANGIPLPGSPVANT
jgi:hypothetical protein